MSYWANSMAARRAITFWTPNSTMAISSSDFSSVPAMAGS